MVPAFILLTRADCGLCREMRAALHRQARGREYACEFEDIDDDPLALEQWRLRIPVLMRGGRIISEGHLDPVAVEAEFVAALTLV